MLNIGLAGCTRKKKESIRILTGQRANGLNGLTYFSVNAF